MRIDNIGSNQYVYNTKSGAFNKTNKVNNVDTDDNKVNNKVNNKVKKKEIFKIFKKIIKKNRTGSGEI